MGLLDVISVCDNCKKAVRVGISGVCPDCGKTALGFGSNGKSDLQVLPSAWKGMSEEEQAKFVNDALATVALNTAEKEESWEYEKYITTTDTFENGEIEEYLGVVSGTEIYMVGGLLGGGIISQEKLVDSSMLKAKQAMMDKALAMGANAIVGVSFTMTSPGNLNYIIYAMTGTAVKVRFQSN